MKISTDFLINPSKSTALARIGRVCLLLMGMVLGWLLAQMVGAGWLKHHETSVGLMKALQVIGAAFGFVAPAGCAALFTAECRPLIGQPLRGVRSIGVVALSLAAWGLSLGVMNRLVAWNATWDYGAWQELLLGMERRAEDLTAQMLASGSMAENLVVMAVIPAMGEEIFFRGGVQRLLGNGHVAVWATALLFAAIHLQFFGIVPRFVMGLMLGYVFYGSRSLMPGMAFHLLNNGMVVVLRTTGRETLLDTWGMGDLGWAICLIGGLGAAGCLIAIRRMCNPRRTA